MSSIKPLLTGVIGALIAATTTWVYLASITIDDGLEALMFVPILVAVLVTLGTIAGLRRRSTSWPAFVALGAVATTTLYLLSLAAVRRNSTLAFASVATSTLVGGLAFGASFVGWAFGTWVKRSQ